jgi:hypothetical protein
MEQTDHRTVYEVYFKSITYKTETRTLTKRNKSKIQVMDITFLGSTERRRDRITNEIFGEEIGI